MIKMNLNNYNINYKSIILLLFLIKTLKQRGITVKTMNLHVLDIKTFKSKFLKIELNSFTMTLLNNYIKTNKNIDSGKYIEVLIPQNLYLEVTNLKKYKSYFRVNVGLNISPKYLDEKIQDKRQQIVINREIDRYKRLFNNIWDKYILQIKTLNKEINTDIKKHTDNYVSVNYVNTGYVTPQY